jgi:hypothetical protein
MHFVSKLLLFATLFIAIDCQAALAAQARATVGAQKGQFKTVELDSFIEQEKKVVGKGKRLIRMAEPVSFQARVKRHPEERPMSYVYEVLELAGVKPVPEVGHRMFVESRGRRIIPVYVEKQAVARIGKELKEGKSARFLGYHLYSYGKGPAILVVDFVGVK